MLGMLKLLSLSTAISALLEKSEEASFARTIPLELNQSLNVSIVGEMVPTKEDQTSSPLPIIAQLGEAFETAIESGKATIIFFEKLDGQDFRVSVSAQLINH